MFYRRVFTIVLGALPATWLAVIAAMGVWYGISLFIANLLSADILGLLGAILMVSWGGLGVYGAISLWAVGLGFTGTFWMEGLMAGIVAIFPLVFVVVLSGGLGLFALLVILPTVVGRAWLYTMHSERELRAGFEEIENDLIELRSRGASR